ncbi:uncharacterized protein SPPG_05117 [Spizellomyces punctatus DAOM BR117]|uniref:UBZ4-type domain-containing protein n=1 Tax=Spizellomyces punctatus (strain DAOM BR117) TaxID=645134 RepID=A0A0L0HF46_SPIPD|nr:uncharacterized protein SPPG_05117 [Spizellomyces punctatus DAOM BR117]KNC99737.1 hypothetical protein SPPG_05117 [Spizellomyces punctatus DAOM BR117]|eukprot:XP_016607777.1 hypothetical protein SPPG_05117 [Spizellomyces punctatus DAOM BR117]
MATFQGLRRSMVSLNAHDHPELNVLITEEKDVMKELHKFAKEKAEAAKYMAVWGKTEHTDVADITEKYLVLFEEFAKFHYTLIERYELYRSRLKEMKAREDSLYVLRKRLKELQEKFKDAIKKQKPHEGIKLELTTVDRDLAEQEAAYEGYKRASFKDAMHLQFDAWMEFANKITIFATFGKYLSDQIPQGSLAPGQELPAYEGATVTTRIVTDFLKELRTYDSQHHSDTLEPNVNHRRSSGASSLNIDDALPPVPSPEPTAASIPQPPPKLYAPHQRASSGEGVPSQEGSPRSHSRESSIPVRSSDHPPSRRYYQAPAPSGSLTAVPYGVAPGGSYLHVPHHGSLPREIPPAAPTGYPPHSNSLPRESMLPGSYNGSAISYGAHPPVYQTRSRPASPLPLGSDTVACPICARAVLVDKINDHLDSRCAMHMVAVASSANGGLLVGYDEYNAREQMQARREVVSGELMSDEEIRQRLERLRVQ